MKIAWIRRITGGRRYLIIRQPEALLNIESDAQRNYSAVGQKFLVPQKKHKKSIGKSKHEDPQPAFFFNGFSFDPTPNGDNMAFSRGHRVRWCPLEASRSIKHVLPNLNPRKHQNSKTTGALSTKTKTKVTKVNPQNIKHTHRDTKKNHNLKKSKSTFLKVKQPFKKGQTTFKNKNQTTFKKVKQHFKNRNTHLSDGFMYPCGISQSPESVMSDNCKMRGQ